MAAGDWATAWVRPCSGSAHGIWVRRRRTNNVTCVPPHGGSGGIFVNSGKMPPRFDAVVNRLINKATALLRAGMALAVAPATEGITRTCRDGDYAPVVE